MRHNRRFRPEGPKRPTDPTLAYSYAEGPCPVDVWGGTETVCSGGPDRDGCDTKHVRVSKTGGLYLMIGRVEGWRFFPAVEVPR